MKDMNQKVPSSLSILFTFILLLAAIFGYALINKYITASPNEKVQNIEEQADGKITDEDAEKIAKEKYYMGIATLTNTKTDIDKLYDQLETTDEVLTNGSLIDSLNNLHGKTFAENSVVTIIENYNDAISDNFTEEYINNNILSPNGFVANINNEYYMYKDKLDNYFFKEAEFKVLSKNEQEMIFEVQNINYAASCASEGNPMPSLTCSDTKKSEKSEFKIVKESSKWKIASMAIKTA